MTNETRTPHKCPTCKASFTDDCEFAEHMGGQCTPSLADAPIEPQPDDYSGAMVRDHDGIVDPADFTRINARGLVDTLRRRARAIEAKDRGEPHDLHVGPMMTAWSMTEAADLIEGLLAERAALAAKGTTK